MSVEQRNEELESSVNLKEISWVSKQVKEELKQFNKESFYEKRGDKIFYNMDTVRQYLGALKDKKTRKELSMRNSSALIMAVQISLYSLNYSFGNIDGILGDKTKEAVKKFQADNNLPVDAYGRSLPSTIQKLLELISKEGNETLQEGSKIDNNLEELDNKVKEEIKEKPDEETTKPKENTEKQGESSEQDIIRPEIQELIDSMNINGDRFENVTNLTKTEAIAIASKARGYFIKLSGIKEINEEVFEEILKFKYGISIGLEKLTVGLARKLVESKKGITFTGLEEMDQEVYEELGKTSGTLRFDALKNVTDDGMKELVKKLRGELYLNKVEEINESVAESIVEYPGEIHLDGVETISKEVAEILSKKKKGKVRMKGLKAPLSEDILEQFKEVELVNLDLNNEVWSQVYDYRKQKEREGKDLSELVLKVIDNKVPVRDLSQLTTITEDEIDMLVKSRLYALDLSGIKEIDERLFEKLLKFKGSIDIGLEKLTVGLARKIVENPKWITFTGLEEMDQEVYEELGKTTGTLRFDALKSVTDGGMKELIKKPRGELYLDKVEEINENIAESIVEYPRNMYLNGVKNITKEVAGVLSNKNKGKVFMKGLEAPLSEDVIEELMKISPINLDLNSDVWIQINRYKKEKENAENQ